MSLKVSTRILFIQLLFVGMTIGLSTAQAMAEQPIPPSLYSGMRWRLVGPFRGGRALAAAGIPGQPNTFYFGSVDGGVWKTTDAGQTWHAMFQHAGTSSIGALAIAHSDPSVIYIGTGEADMRSDMSFGDGVYKSTDGGKTWRHMGLIDTRHIGRILVDPKDPNTVLVAALGHAYGPNQQRGVFRSTDGGKTWKKVLYKNPRTGAIDLAMNPTNPEVMYAALWQSRRPPWSQYPPLNGPGGGLYKSTDGGRTWKQIVGHGLPKSDLGRIGVAVAYTKHGRRVYALIQAKEHSESGLYRSDDAGRHWKQVSHNKQITTRMWYFGRVTVDPADPDTVFIPNRSIFRSTDGGETYKVIKGKPGGDDYHFLWINPDRPADMVVATDQGTTVTLNKGASWSTWYNQPTGQFYHVSTDNQFPYRIYGAQQDSGTVSILNRSPNDAISERDWHSTAGGESGYVFPKPDDPNIVYGGGISGQVQRMQMSLRQQQNISPWPVYAYRKKLPRKKYRTTWTAPLAVNPQEPNALYFGAQFLLKTIDGGLNWKKLSPDLTGAQRHPSTQGQLTVKNARQRGYGVIYSIAPSTIDTKQIWAGTDDGFLWLTRDNGEHWQNVTPKDVSPWSKIAIIEASPFAEGTAYIIVDRHRLNDYKPYIYRTKNYGDSWTKITAGLTAPNFVRVVRADPKRKGLFYAGTEMGIYVSFNNGGYWQPLQLNLPTVSVRDLAIHDNDLIAATHGRSFWVLDDLSPLRQMRTHLSNAAAHLFSPAPAIRMRADDTGGTPLAPGTPTGENPPTGAVLYYYVKSDVTDPISLNIRDADGNLVRHYASNQKHQKIDYSKVYFKHSWLKSPEKLSTSAGTHRFVWNLRYNAPPTIRPTRHAQGPLVRPGHYQVELTVEGKTYRKGVDVKMDPRAHVPAAVLGKQLKFAQRIERSMAKAQRAYRQVGTVRKQIKSLKAAAPRQNRSQKIMKALNTLGSKVKALEKGERFDTHNFANVNSRLLSLEEKVESVDRKLPQSYYDLFHFYERHLHKALTQWHKLQKRRMPKINRELRQNHMRTIKLKQI